MSVPPTCEACLNETRTAKRCDNLGVYYCRPCRNHGHACECYGGDTICDAYTDQDPSDPRPTEGWCPIREEPHEECEGRCGRPDEHWCDAPNPVWPDRRCMRDRGHDGDCKGPNGKTWGTPEPYSEREPVSTDWKSQPWERSRPDGEETLEAFA